VFNSVAAMRHLHSQKDSSGSKPSCRAAVTHRLEHMDFLKPIYIGNLAKLQARVIFVKNASLLVEVIVKAEDLTKVSESLCNKAYVWYLSMEVVAHSRCPLTSMNPVIMSIDQSYRIRRGGRTCVCFGYCILHIC